MPPDTTAMIPCGISTSFEADADCLQYTFRCKDSCKSSCSQVMPLDSPLELPVEPFSQSNSSGLSPL